MPRMDSSAGRPPSARAGFQEPRELVHVLVEEGEHGNRAVASFLEVLVHQVEIRVACKEPHLDVRAAFDELGHERYVGQTGAAPVLADDEHAARSPEPLENLGVTGLDRDLVERVHEALAIDGHVIDVLLQGQPLLEPFFRDHRRLSIGGRAAAGGATSYRSPRAWGPQPPAGPAARTAAPRRPAARKATSGRCGLARVPYHGSLEAHPA